MSTETAKHAIKTLQDNFRRSFPEGGIRGIWKELIAQPEKAIERAADGLVLSNSYLPSPQQLLDRVKLEAKKLATEQSRQREKEWHDQKGGADRRELERKGSIFSREQSDRHAQHAVQAIRLMLSDTPREDKLECFRVMESNYPGAGWGIEGARLQKEWQETKQA